MFSRQIKIRKVKKIISRLKKLFPDTEIMLHYSNNWELLVAVILSAQCTDKQVNKVTAKLFSAKGGSASGGKKYRTLEDYVRAKPREFEQDIHSTGFYKNKTKHILGAAKMVKEKFGGSIPRTMEEMLTIPGVGRKTANVVLGNAYGVVEGIAVDTHVRRLSRLLGLTKHNDPNTIEQDLMRIVPRKDWFSLNHLLVSYGRKYCPARKHDHKNCPLSKIS